MRTQSEEQRGTGVGIVAYDRILVAMDTSRLARHAGVVAAELARRFAAPIEYLSAVESMADVHARRAELQRHIGLDELPDGQVDVVRSMDPAGSIVAHARRTNALVVMSTHGRGRIAGALLGSVTRNVIREVRAPIVLVGPAFDPQNGFGLERLVTCVDGSAASEAILPVAAAWSTTLGLRLDVVNVVAPTTPAGISLGPQDVGDISEFNYVRRLAATLRHHGISPQWEVLHDDEPAAPILRYAADPAGSMIALSTHGRTGLSHLTMGSVATRIAHRSPVPMLVLRPALHGA